MKLISNNINQVINDLKNNNIEGIRSNEESVIVYINYEEKINFLESYDESVCIFLNFNKDEIRIDFK